jgi:ADP-heptose:LPS heptosyltransferase
MMNPVSPRRVLIYRLGSLGDTVVALPALRLVARAFPGAERYMLTNYSLSDKAAPVAQVLSGTGLINGYLEYPVRLRNLGKLMDLVSRIRELSPEVLVYLAAPRGLAKAWRDAFFFRACGIRNLVGLPVTLQMQKPLKIGNERYEYEGARLARCLSLLGDSQFDERDAFSLALTGDEHLAAERALGARMVGRRLLAVSIGGKAEVKDWGDANWSFLLKALGQKLPGWGLAMVGAPVEYARSQQLLNCWPGASINLCGALNVRETAAALQRASIFCGHDSGPMHLAAAVGTVCVAIFSARNLPGEWFPYGRHHRVIYHPMECQGCGLEACVVRDKACIRSIKVDEVLDAVLQTVGRQ